MLRSKSIERKITKVAIAENVKLEGISETSRRLLDAGEGKSLSEIIAEYYKDPEAPLFNKVGFTVSLPFTLVLSAICKTGAMGISIISKLQEQQTIDQLVAVGVIPKGSENYFIQKVQALNESNGKIFEFTANDLAQEGGRSR